MVLDLAKLWRAPFNPHAIVAEQARELRRFGLLRVTGDNYGAEFLVGSFSAQGIRYTKSDMPKSELYRELLPRLCSAEIELLDDEKLVDQIANLAPPYAVPSTWEDGGGTGRFAGLTGH